MGVLRNFSLVIVAVLLFISFLLVGTFATLNSSLNYNVVKSPIKQVMRESINFTPIYNYEDILNNSCINETNYTYLDANNTFIIPCKVIANGTDAIIDYQLDSLIEDNYYKEYNCTFFDCFKKVDSPFFLVSKHSQDYWNSRFYHFLFFSIILLGLLFLLVEKKNNFPILSGILLIVAFIPVALLDSIGKFVLKLILSSMKHAVGGIASLDLNSFVMIFFSQANSVFLTGLSIGLVLIGGGILLKVFKAGFKIGKLFKKKEGKKEKVNEKEEEKVQPKKSSSKSK